jgi:hypothetical protein
MTHDWALYSPDQASGSGPVLSIDQANQLAQATPTVVMGGSSGIPLSMPAPPRTQPTAGSEDDKQTTLFME